MVVEVAGGIGGFPAYAIPQEVQTYVVQQPVEAVTVHAPVLISRRVRKGVTLHRVKRRAAYVHAHVKGQPVLVQAHAREIYSVVQR